MTVTVTDTGGNTVSKKVKVTVTNVEEDGKVSLSHTHPEVGARLTATLTDPDRPSGRVTWQWYRGDPPDPDSVCDADDANDCRITRSATSASYIPVAGDEDETLTARASYRDGEGKNKTASANTTAIPCRKGG